MVKRLLKRSPVNPKIWHYHHQSCYSGDLHKLADPFNFVQAVEVVPIRVSIPEREPAIDCKLSEANVVTDDLAELAPVFPFLTGGLFAVIQ